MNKNEVIELLSSISIGTIIAWVVVIAMIVGLIGAGFVKLYKVFDKTRKIKEKDDEIKKMVKDHDEKLSEISTQLSDIQGILKKQDESNLKSMRHSIVRACEEAIVRGTITIREYRSLYELYDEYHDERHGNGYVTSLMKKLNANVQIIGKLDEHGEDIE